MENATEWVVRGITSALVAAFAYLFLRVRTNEKDLAVAAKTLGRYEKTEEDVNDLKVLAARIEERLRHLPTQADLERLHERISKNGNATSDVRQQVAALGESVKGVRSGVDRLQELELQRSKP